MSFQQRGGGGGLEDLAAAGIRVLIHLKRESILVQR